MPHKIPHILQVTILRYPEIIGGVDTMVYNLTDGLTKHVKVSVFVPGSWEQENLSTKVYNDLKVYSIRLRMPFTRSNCIKNFLAWLYEFPKTLLTLKGIIKDNQINLIHLHLAHSKQFYFVALKWLTNVPYVLTLHGSDVVEYDKLSLIDKFLVKLVLSQSAHINAVSKWLANLAQTKFPSIKKTSTVYNGLNLSALEESYLRASNKYNFPYFVMIGSFDPYKGHLTAIEAWRYVKESNPDIQLIIAGEGDLRPNYEKLIAEIGCQETIHLIGQVSHNDVIGLLKYAKGMIFPSINEGLGYVLLEAGATQTPVICSAIFPFLEIIENCENGLIVYLNDPFAIAEAVKNIIQNPEWADTMAMRLKNKIYQEFSSDNMTNGYLKIYRDVLK